MRVRVTELAREAAGPWVDLICARTGVTPTEAGWMWNSPQDCPDLLTLAAYADDGSPLGVGRLTTPVLLPPTWAVLNVTVARDAEDDGVGSTLFEALLDRRRDDVDQLRVTVDADDPRSVAIARHWGFEVVQTSIESSLDLSDLSTLPWPEPGPGTTLHDVSSWTFEDEDAVAAMLLASQTHPEALQGMVTSLADLRRSGSAVAVLARVDGVPAGIVSGFVEDRILFVDYTGVDPRFRGRGLARLLKQRAHLDGARLGAWSTRTTNAEHNTGIRRLNAELGYEVTRALTRMRRVLDGGRAATSVRRPSRP